MKKHYLIDFKKGESGIKGKTKFGGQPDWIDKPEWPLSMEYGEPMQFICQIELEAIGFTDFEAKFAYLFMGYDRTWEPDGGENAIILQPGDNSRFDLEEMLIGPSISISDKQNDNEGCNVDLKLLVGEEAEKDESINRFGGEPDFLQGEAYPYNSTSRVEIIDREEKHIAEKWHLLIQVYADSIPYFVNFGDCGEGYGFIRDDGKVAKFLWQCH